MATFSTSIKLPEMGEEKEEEGRTESAFIMLTGSSERGSAWLCHAKYTLEEAFLIRERLVYLEKHDPNQA